jgi:hypothetical protein
MQCQASQTHGQENNSTRTKGPNMKCWFSWNRLYQLDGFKCDFNIPRNNWCFQINTVDMNCIWQSIVMMKQPNLMIYSTPAHEEMVFEMSSACLSACMYGCAPQWLDVFHSYLVYILSVSTSWKHFCFRQLGLWALNHLHLLTYILLPRHVHKISSHYSDL